MSRTGCGATMQCTPTTGGPLWPAWGVHQGQGRQGLCPWFLAASCACLETPGVCLLPRSGLLLLYQRFEP
jgi:hypothetical protein